MTRQWSDWSAAPWKSQSAYVDWWYQSPAAGFGEEGNGQRPLRSTLSYVKAPVRGSFSNFLSSGTRAQTAGAIASDDFELPGVPALFGQFSDPLVPLPGNVSNPEFDTHYDTHGTWAPDAAVLPIVRADTVIVGCIDAGIGLGNSRFRDRAGATRILAAWQQGAARNMSPGQPYLPFGRELYKADIDGLLRAHSTGSYLAEDDFNSAAGLVDMVNPLGTRDLAGRHSHGNMVLDLAAGSDPASSDDRIKIIAVNLPNRRSLNNSGIFLDYFTLFGIKRIVDLADAVYRKSRDASVAARDGQVWPPSGLPIVINLSFGKNAGAKDGLDHFNAAVREINISRVRSGLLPVQLVIPVGNHNLEQGNGALRLPSGAEGDITFRTFPEDQSSNYLEIWSEAYPLADGIALNDVTPSLEIAILAPGQTGPEWGVGRHLQARTLGTYAKLYCVLHPAPDLKSYKLHYLLCTAPTLLHDRSEQPVAPAGRWRIMLRNTARQDTTVLLSVQTDQSILPHGGTGVSARLEHPDYRRFDETTGRPLDSCDPAALFAGGVADVDAPLRRHGSINATAASRDIIAVAGYRRTDGKAAAYSATGHGVALHPLHGRSEPSLALPTDDSATLFGILAAGAASGSVVAMRGTSFAAAQATRLVAEELKQGPAARQGLQVRLQAKAASHDRAATFGPSCAVKTGAGRLPSAPLGRVSRTAGGQG